MRAVLLRSHIAIAMFACVSAAFADDDAVADPGVAIASKLSADVRAVSSAGLWFHSGREGWLRFVVLGGGVERYTTRLYLQWFVQPIDAEESVLDTTVAVEELNGSPHEPAFTTNYSFAAPRCERRVPCSRALVEALDVRSGEVRQFMLILDGEPGLYRIEERLAAESGG